MSFIENDIIYSATSFYLSSQQGDDWTEIRIILKTTELTLRAAGAGENFPISVFRQDKFKEIYVGGAPQKIRDL